MQFYTKYVEFCDFAVNIQLFLRLPHHHFLDFIIDGAAKEAGVGFLGGNYGGVAEKFAEHFYAHSFVDGHHSETMACLVEGDWMLEIKLTRNLLKFSVHMAV